MKKFQISGTILNGEVDGGAGGEMAHKALLVLASQLNMKLEQQHEQFLLSNAQGELLIEPPLIQGGFDQLDGMEMAIRDCFQQIGCLWVM